MNRVFNAMLLVGVAAGALTAGLSSSSPQPANPSLPRPDG
jgi:hypothetical protein